jgi:tetratricopeptide (TPR) repeat protein
MFATALGAPALALLLFWFWLALRRARTTDPLLPRREARDRIADTLAALRTAKDPAQIAALLLAWQKDTAILWQISQAVPATTNFPTGEPKWTALWADTERALYRNATPLPADWVSRAETALQDHPVRSFSALQLFRLSNLFPFAALLALAFLAPATTLLAADGRNAYDRGDFAAAEQVWRKTLAETPTNPAAHHNLALALAQQNHWGEAAAHAAAAFAQQPNNTAISWNLAFTLERAGFAPSVFSGFARSHPPHLLARQLSAPGWQFAAIFAVALAAIAGALLLIRAYGNRGRWLKITAITLFTLATLLGGAAAFSLRVYSPVNDVRSAIVWRAATLRSIPTEADTTQKTTSLSAGTVAVVDRTFLSERWARLSFPNGQTGWVRQEDLVKLWR